MAGPGGRRCVTCGRRGTDRLSLFIFNFLYTIAVFPFAKRPSVFCCHIQCVRVRVCCLFFGSFFFFYSRTLAPAAAAPPPDPRGSRTCQWLVSREQNSPGGLTYLLCSSVIIFHFAIEMPESLKCLHRYPSRLLTAPSLRPCNDGPCCYDYVRCSIRPGGCEGVVPRTMTPDLSLHFVSTRAKPLRRGAFHETENRRGIVKSLPREKNYLYVIFQTLRTYL